ncbi:type IV pilus modification protein PilV [Luteimonas mephitis]|uniref:type IV pilus modification protein PilV n=1 Tax=Luteimonas mephitis TaxID=83615 RepID=UPI003A95B1A4
MKRLNQHRKAAGGFSMIEVLITLVVLAFGLLGLGLLQTMNLRYTKSANERTQAVNLAGEILDMMRSNRSELATYELPETSLSSVTLPNGGCGASTSLGAKANLDRWKCEVREALGESAKVKITPNVATSSVSVDVQWDESNMPGSGQGKITLESQL